jgi:hypothetical protein
MDRRTRRELLARLTADAQRITRQFGLRYRSLEAERSNVTSRYGICYDDGTIKIRLNHSVTGEPLKYSSLVNTLCHELAHLRHFDHGPRFKMFYLEVLRWSRQQGIYRPRAGGPSRQIAVTATVTTVTSVTTGTSGAVVPETLREPRRPAGPRQLDLFGSSL